MCQVRQLPLIKTIKFPEVVLDILLKSLELGVELAVRLTEDLEIVYHVKRVQIKRLGMIDVRRKLFDIHNVFQG